MAPIEKLLTRNEAAESLTQSVRKVDMEIANGNLPAVRIGRSIRIRPSALARYVEARESRTKVKVRKGKEAAR